jgi:hypothetical protein
MVTINVLDYDNLPAVFDARTYFASVREDAQKVRSPPPPPTYPYQRKLVQLGNSLLGNPLTNE